MQASVVLLKKKNKDKDAPVASPQIFPVPSYSHFLLTDIPMC